MIMMVLNKGKLKKILIFILIILVIVAGLTFTLKRNQSTPSINILDLAKEPYNQGTKENSGYVALTCNVDLGWEDEYVISILEAVLRIEYISFMKHIHSYIRASVHESCI